LIREHERYQIRYLNTKKGDAMKKGLFIGTVLLVLIVKAFLAGNLFAATYDLTGTWNYTLSGNWASGDIGCNPGPAATGTCTIAPTPSLLTIITSSST